MIDLPLHLGVIGLGAMGAEMLAVHARYAIAAMRSGKAVFCEKPLAVDLTEGEEMVNVAAPTGLVNALNYTLLADFAAGLRVQRAIEAFHTAG
jgi:predicted dehydrogenase